MHDQKRSEYKSRLKDATISAGLTQKARQWHALTAELMSRRCRYCNQVEQANDELSSLSKTPDLSSSWMKGLVDDLHILDKLLVVHPDPLYLWNHRREILRILTKSDNTQPRTSQEDMDSNIFLDALTFLQQEQNVTTICLKRNPKAYGVWFHRKWVLRQWILLQVPKLLLLSNTTETNVDQTSSLTSRIDSSNMNSYHSIEETLQAWKVILDQELNLCADFLHYDERNFHCWNYRRFIVSILALIYTLMRANATHTVKTDDIWKDQGQMTHFLQSRLDGSWWWGNDDAMDSTIAEQHPSETVSVSSLAAGIMGAQVKPNLLLNQSTFISKYTFPSLVKEDEEQLLQTEWDFTQAKISQNFSNCSAFHYRSKILPLLLDAQFRNRQNMTHDHSHEDWIWIREEEKNKLAQGEFELIHNAIYTEPDDQTAWWYHRFIVEWLNPYSNQWMNLKETSFYEGRQENCIDNFMNRLQGECSIVRELIETENGHCKWGYLALHFLLSTCLRIRGNSSSNVTTIDEKSEWIKEAHECLLRLKEIDPYRSSRYDCMMIMDSTDEPSVKKG